MLSQDFEDSVKSYFSSLYYHSNISNEEIQRDSRIASNVRSFVNRLKCNSSIIEELVRRADGDVNYIRYTGLVGDVHEGYASTLSLVDLKRNYFLYWRSNWQLSLYLLLRNRFYFSKQIDVNIFVDKCTHISIIQDLRDVALGSCQVLEDIISEFAFCFSFCHIFGATDMHASNIVTSICKTPIPIDLETLFSGFFYLPGNILPFNDGECREESVWYQSGFFTEVADGIDKEKTINPFRPGIYALFDLAAKVDNINNDVINSLASSFVDKVYVISRFFENELKSAVTANIVQKCYYSRVIIRETSIYERIIKDIFSNITTKEIQHLLIEIKLNESLLRDSYDTRERELINQISSIEVKALFEGVIPSIKGGVFFGQLSRKTDIKKYIISRALERACSLDNRMNQDEIARLFVSHYRSWYIMQRCH